MPSFWFGNFCYVGMDRFLTQTILAGSCYDVIFCALHCCRCHVACFSMYFDWTIITLCSLLCPVSQTVYALLRFCSENTATTYELVIAGFKPCCVLVDQGSSVDLSTGG